MSMNIQTNETTILAKGSGQVLSTSKGSGLSSFGSGFIVIRFSNMPDEANGHATIHVKDGSNATVAEVKKSGLLGAVGSNGYQYEMTLRINPGSASALVVVDDTATTYYATIGLADGDYTLEVQFSGGIVGGNVQVINSISSDFLQINDRGQGTLKIVNKVYED